MKLLQNSNKLLILFLVGLFFANIIQAYTTELLADEAYYWMYSNFLDWGYFDHPPMVAVWISISKLFFSTGELSVRFFSTITLSITFYLTWLLIEHPKKKENTSLFILIIATTALFNVYGFITVPDTPLMFFMAIFLLGYKIFLKEKVFLNYAIMTIGISGMMYSKYQAILIVVFVLLSNIKVLKDYKIWLMTFTVILLYIPHLYWQYNNGYASFKYHLVERTQNKAYKLENTIMLFVNMLAIIGFTFPIIYTATFKSIKSKNLFTRALIFLVIGFIAFFFVSTFKGPTQAQWIVPISFSLIIISFNYIVDNPKVKKIFTRLALITLIVTVGIRFIMANDILPVQMEMHGNEAWAKRLEDKLEGKPALFRNSYQNPSLYWFYTGKRPFQYNAWYKRKNHYDLLDYNKKANQKEIIQIGKTNYNTGSVLTKNKRQLYLNTIKNYKKEGIIITELSKPIVKENAKNILKINIENPNEITLSKLKLEIVFKDIKRQNLKTNTKIFKATLIDNSSLEFVAPVFNDNFTPKYIQIIGSINKSTKPVRIGLIECEFIK